MLSMDGKSTMVGGRELSLSDEGSENLISGGPVGEPRSKDRRCSAEDDGDRGILFGSFGSGLSDGSARQIVGCAKSDEK